MAAREELVHVSTDNLIACETCGLVQRMETPPRHHHAQCARCTAVLQKSRVNSRARTAALSLAALFLYVPANIYPIMTMEYMGRHTENTVWGGVKTLAREHMWFVAAIVFCASILVPFLKLAGLFFLVVIRHDRWQRQRTSVYKIISAAGPWAMLDVFLLAILVSLLRFGRFATVVAGPGVVAFTAVVVLTLLASACFDPQLIWQRTENGERKHA